MLSKKGWISQIAVCVLGWSILNMGFVDSVLYAQEGPPVNTGCCYEVTFYTYQRETGTCRWTCQVGELTFTLSTAIYCNFDVMKFIQCRDPEAEYPCGAEDLPLGHSRVSLDCDSFGVATFPLDYFCYEQLPGEVDPFWYTVDCQRTECEVPEDGSILFTPSYEECVEKGCCGTLET